MKPGTRVDHDRFCVNDEWVTVRNARGGEVGHHVTYELALADGRVLRTRISRPVRKVTYGPSLWKTILREQLDVTEDEFWQCVSKRIRPERGLSEPDVPPAAIPADLVHQLIHKVRVPENEVAAMDLAEAIARLSAYWSTPKDP